MRIVLVNKFYYNRGGDCIHTIALKDLLERKGHQVAVFSMQYGKNYENEYNRYWPSELVLANKSVSNVIRVLTRPLNSTEVAAKWKLLIRDFNPDVVHLHNIHTQLSPVIAQIAYSYKIPVVWTLHDYKLICPAYSMLRAGSVCELCLEKKWSVVTHRCIKDSFSASLLGYLEALRWNKKVLQKYTKVFISPSRFLKHKMMEFGFEGDKIVQICNFIPKVKTPQKKIEIERGDYLVYIGRLSAEKGIQTLLKALSLLPDKKLKIIGGDFFPNLADRHYNNLPNVEFLGFRDWPFICRMLGKAKSIIVPSEWYENNPLSIIESLIQGTPVIGANIGGIPELIDSTNGLLFEAGNVDDLIQKVQMMYHKVDWDYQKISEEAVRKFSEEVFYKKLTSIYEQFVSV